MSVARFKDLCIDVNSPSAMAAFWGELLGLTAPADNPEVLTGDHPEQTVWLNKVAEPRTVKQRVHLDVHVTATAEPAKLGATVVDPPSREHHWTIMADPEGGEFCAFVRDSVPSYRLMELVVDSADAEAQAHWWADLVGGEVNHQPENPWYWLENVPGLPCPYWVFVPVPEPKTVKNRIHWDVSADDLQPVLDAGATMLRRRDEQIGWHVLADPEGNEFCVFLPPTTEAD